MRGGKAHGDDGSEPTLIATGVTDGEYTLTYERWRTVDVLAFVLSLAALVGCAALLFRRRVAERIEAPLRRMEVIGHPVVWAALVVGLVLFGLVKVSRGRAAEAGQAYGRVLNGQADLRAAKAAFLKTDMLIRPAVVFNRRHKKPAAAVFTGVTLGETLTGWVAIDDDHAKMKAEGKHEITIEARPTGGGEWTKLWGTKYPHKANRRLLEIPTQALAGIGGRRPRAGHERRQAPADYRLRPRSRFGGAGVMNRAQARLVLGAVAAVTALELLAATHVYGESIDEEDWAAARAAVEALPEGDAGGSRYTVARPAGALGNPRPRRGGQRGPPRPEGDRSPPTCSAWGSDAWSSELDADLEGADRPAPASEQEVGPFTLTTYDLGTGRILDRITPRKGGPDIVEIDYRPRACIPATPKSDGEPVVLRKARMELGSELRGHVGFSDFNGRLRNDTPARVEVRVGGRTVARFLTSDEEGWRPFVVPTSPGTTDVEVGITVGVRGQWGKQGLSDRQPRHVCLELRSL